MTWQSDTINPASTSPAGDITKITNDLQQLRTVMGGGTDAAIPSAFPLKAEIVAQALTKATTGGTSTAYTLTPGGAITAYAAGQSFWVTFHTASGASPTLQISGVATPPALVRYNTSGALVAIGASELPSGFASRVTLLSTTQALVEDMPPSGDTMNTTRIDVASAATVSLTGSAPNTRHINITGTTAITAFTVAVGLTYFVRFNASLTLTNNASIITQTGASIVTQAGDTCILRATAANVVEVLSYVRATPIQLQTSIATTSGTTAGFTNIPAGVKRVSVMVSGVSTAGATNVGLQVGSGSYSTTGYTGAQSQLNGATGSSSNTSTTIPLDNAASAVNVRHGKITLDHMGGNLWVWSGVVACAGSSIVEMTAGSIQLGGALDRVQALMNGADTFDAGSINISWEF